MLQLKPFQRDDLSRAAILDSAILGWEQGLGKSLAAIALPLIKRARSAKGVDSRISLFLGGGAVGPGQS